MEAITVAARRMHHLHFQHAGYGAHARQSINQSRAASQTAPAPAVREVLQLGDDRLRRLSAPCTFDNGDGDGDSDGQHSKAFLATCEASTPL